MARTLYTLFFYLMMPFILLRLAYRSIRAPEYGDRVRERFGLFTAPSFDDCIWVHAVSVGETIAAVPLVRQLQQRYPDRAIVITTMTPTGSERVKALLADEVFHVYAPYDLPGSIKRFLTRVSPRVLIIMETELWPNTIHYCYQNAIPVVLANARLSEKSVNGYRKLPSLSGGMLEEISSIAAQHSNDGDRFLSLGLPRENLSITGSIKFDIDLPEVLVEQARCLKTQWTNASVIDDGEETVSGCESGKRLNSRLVVLAASTHEGEEELILSAYQHLLVELEGGTNAPPLLILVPRHPERFSRVVVMSEQLGFETIRRSSGVSVLSSTQVMVGDTMGELLLLYGCADIAVVGGSLVSNGGHNMLEAAAWALPIVTGSSHYNFFDISNKLQEADALVVANDETALLRELQSLLEDPMKRRRMGSAALQVVEQNRGSLQRLVDVIDPYLAR